MLTLQVTRISSIFWPIIYNNYNIENVLTFCRIYNESSIVQNTKVCLDPQF